MYTRKNYGILADPHIISNHRIAFKWQVRWFWRLHIPTLKRVERKCRYGIHLMICAIHHELNSGRNLTELSNN